MTGNIEFQKFQTCHYYCHIKFPITERTLYGRIVCHNCERTEKRGIEKNFPCMRVTDEPEHTFVIKFNLYTIFFNHLRKVLSVHALDRGRCTSQFDIKNCKERQINCICSTNNELIMLYY